jgi:hypothetical protein
MPRPVRGALVSSIAALLLASLAAFATACGLTQAEPAPATPTPVNANMLANPGFEAGSDPWQFPESPLNTPFAITPDQSNRGAHSLELTLLTERGSPGIRATGASQTLSSTTTFPEFASGYIRFADWQQSDPPVHAEFIVTVRGGDFGDAIDAHEVRFILAGLPVEPPGGSQGGTRYLFLNRDDPEDFDDWIYFGYPVLDAFRGKFGRVPSVWASIELSVQLRHFPRPEGSPPSRAKVFFDDLYMGPQLLNPNRPILGVLPDS